jgi:hypothetical protein
MMFPGKMLMAARRGGRHPVDAVLQGSRDDGVPGRDGFLRADLHARGGDVQGGLNHVGTSSLEIGVKVLAEKPLDRRGRHACTAYLTYVHLGVTSGPGRAGRSQPGPRGAAPLGGGAGSAAAPLARVKRLEDRHSNERG